MSARQLGISAAGSAGHRWFRVVSLAVAGLLLGLPLLRAQDDQKPDETPAKADETAGATPAKADEPEEITLTTEDGLILKASYYAGANGQDSIPVVLLHGFKGSRKDFAEMAPKLQKDLGCAVLVPDLRGHGDSTKMKNGGILNPARLKQRDFAAMASQDMAAIRLFLLEENNGQGKTPRLNMNKLCVVGVGMGAGVALEFARNDWNSSPVGRFQTGGFCKALVLISPELRSAHGVSLLEILKDENVRSQPSVMLLFGKDGSKAKDAERVNKLLEPAHRLSGSTDKTDKPDKDKKDEQSLFYVPLETALQGSNLLTENSLGVPDLIKQFVSRRLIECKAAKKYKWKLLRKDPYVKEPGE